MSSPVRLIIKLVINIVLVWAAQKYLSQYIILTGGPAAWIVIGALLTLLNIFLRPLLEIVTFPLKLFATILAIILANGVFLYVAEQIIGLMDPALVSMHITNIGGWIVLSLGLGLANWMLKELLHRRD